MNQALELIFRTAHRQLKPRTAVPDITVEYFPFAGLNHTARLNQGQLHIRISDIFMDAPDEVVHSLALILLAKLYRKKVGVECHRHYRMFILSGEIQERARAARSSRCRATRGHGPRGRHYDLDPLFEEVNGRYFAGTIQKPRLSWSAKRSRYVLGRYDSTRHTIYISRVFDAPSVPRYVVEYVMFHEMLHVKHQSMIHESRVIVHTPEFKKEERSFLHYTEAKLWLKQI